MHTLNSVKGLLHSLPIEVEFAGFRGNTLALAQAGWDLSMQQEYSQWGEYVLRLAMRHEGAQLYALSSPVFLELGEMGAATQDAMRYAKFLAQIRFRIQHVAPDIRLRIEPGHRTVGRMADAFAPIDPFPQERIVEESIRDFKFFRAANPELKDIIVSPDQVPELLGMVLKAQEKTMKDVRGRERSRENLERYRAEFGHVKPAHSVQAQIITLAS